MDRIRPATRALFASGMIGLGLAGLWYGDFAVVLREIPTWVPARMAIVYAAAALMLVSGIGLLFERTAALGARVLFFYLALWVLLLDVPMVLMAPLVVNSWATMAHIVVLLAGGWVLFAAVASPPDGSTSNVATGKRGARIAQLLFGLALPPLGLAHFAYLSVTVSFVPAWLPYRTAWAYLTGTAQIAAGFAVLFSIVPRLAATLEAAMLTVFTILVWIPAIVARPSVERSWEGLTVSWACSAAAWAVAASISRDDRLTKRA